MCNTVLGAWVRSVGSADLIGFPDIKLIAARSEFTSTRSAV